MNKEEIYKLRKTCSDYFKKHHYQEALNSYYELIKQYSSSEKVDNFSEIFKTMFRQGVCYFLLNNYENASQCFKNSDELYIKNNLENESRTNKTHGK